MEVIPYSEDGYRLLHEGAAALAQCECNGVCIDVPYVQRAVIETNAKIKTLEEQLEQTNVVKEWRKRYRSKTNIYSAPQLAHVLFDVMGFPKPARETEHGKAATDGESLLDIDDPFVPLYLQAKKYTKAVSTYFLGTLREVVDGRIHPFFDLHTAISYRSSCKSPNQQNQPARDPELMRLIRTAFVASPGNQLVEIDFSGAEVRVGAGYHRDPKMVEYLLDKSTDMHRDAAADLFFMPPETVPKPIRFEAKSNFVFAEFYGSYYRKCAPHLWKVAHELSLSNGTNLIDHLIQNGIPTLGTCDPEQRPVPGTFEHHVQKVERILWEERFKEYAAWKKSWFAEYQEKGWFVSLTGFIYQGLMDRNDVTNYPIQGSSFHVLLWCLNRLVLKELPKRNMRTKIIGQIHDSILADVPPSELDDFLDLCYRVMVRKTQRHFKWFVVPMEIEAGVAPVGGSWADKKERKLEAA
jgi:DNA polymerase-1